MTDRSFLEARGHSAHPGKPQAGTRHPDPPKQSPLGPEEGGPQISLQVQDSLHVGSWQFCLEASGWTDLAFGFKDSQIIIVKGALRSCTNLIVQWFYLGEPKTHSDSSQGHTARLGWVQVPEGFSPRLGLHVIETKK